MKRVNIIILSIAMMGAGSCSLFKSKSNTNKDFTLVVKTSPCFGRCPFYELSVDSKGEARYKGIRHPKTDGEIVRNLSAIELDSVRYIFETNNFWGLDSVYDNPSISDFPSTTISYNTVDKQKTVFARFDTPMELRKITAFIERLRKRTFGDLE